MSGLVVIILELVFGDEVKDCDEADGGFVKGEKPYGEGLGDVDVEKGRFLVKDWIVAEFISY